MTCNHDGRSECWLCSNAVSWWREARIKAGLPEEPPNEPYWEQRRIEARIEMLRWERERYNTPWLERV